MSECVGMNRFHALLLDWNDRPGGIEWRSITGGRSCDFNANLILNSIWRSLASFFFFFGYFLLYSMLDIPRGVRQERCEMLPTAAL